tara:strand:- start:211 stop:669 length:459 start_codon:yes stop_codon:yes gene_type:complete
LIIRIFDILKYIKYQQVMNSSNKILAPISIGELIDKITILEIKIEKIQDNNKQKFIKHELESLNKLLADINFSEDQKKTINSLKEELNTANRKLWKIEDDIRQLESIKKFNEEFIELARNVYLTNDKRASLKQKLNQITNSDIVEVKSYKKY